MKNAEQIKEVRAKITRLNALREKAVDPFISANRLNDQTVEATFKNSKYAPHSNELGEYMLMTWQRLELSESIIRDLVNLML
jgi:hypothetical protein